MYCTVNKGFDCAFVCNAQDPALDKAKSAIQAYFSAILNGDSTLAPNMAMSQANDEVPDKDSEALQNYYDQASFLAAKQAVDAYVKMVSAGQDLSTAADRMHEIEDALSPQNLQKIKLYYDQSTKPAISTSSKK